MGLVDSVFPEFFSGRAKKIIGWAFTIAIIMLFGGMIG